MECVANHDTTDSRAFPADVCSFRDLIGDCSMVAMPPVCTQAFFQATWRLPPQFSDFDQVRRLSMTGCAVHKSKFRGACFASGPSFPRSLPASRFRPNSVAHTMWRVRNCNEFSRLWRSMTCFCQQEILDRLLFSDATCQEDISTYGPTPVRPMLSLVFESIKVCATFWCMCTKSDRVCVPRHSLVLRCFVRVWEAIRLS